MKQVVAIRHIPFEDLGAFDPLLRRRGYHIEYVDICTDPIRGLSFADADLLILLGGPIGAFEESRYPLLLDELQLAERRLAERRPLLGICLGAQIMARALGAGVSPMAQKEIGFAPIQLTEAAGDSCLAPLPADLPVLHWHGDQFSIPDGATHLARTEQCPNQAFAWGDTALALQFHLEADPRRIEQWLVGHAAELAGAGIDPVTLRQQAAGVRDHLPLAATAVLEHWLDNLGL